MKHDSQIYFNDKAFYFRDGTSDSIILQHNLLCDSYEREYKFPQGDPKVIVDIGANIGAISVLMANLYPNATIYAFEPMEDNFELLEMNVREYPQVKIFNFALGDQDAMKEMLTSSDPKNFGGHSFHEFGCDPSAPKEYVAVCETNSVLDKLKIGKIDLLKIDCEGAEAEILMGLTPERLDQISVIVGELHCHRDFELLDHLAPSFHLEFKKDLQDKTYQFRAFNRNLIVEKKS